MSLPHFSCPWVCRLGPGDERQPLARNIFLDRPTTGPGMDTTEFEGTEEEVAAALKIQAASRGKATRWAGLDGAHVR